MRKALCLMAMLLLVVSTLSGCGEKESETVKVALVAPLTGDFAEYGTGFDNAVKLLANEWNEKGGVLGKQIEVISYDDKNSGEEAASIAERIVGDKSISAVVGHFASGVCMAASPTYQEIGIAEISPSASHPDYSSEGDYIFRNNSLINVEAAETLEIATEVFDAKRVAILSVKTDWGTSTSDILINDLAAEFPNLEIVGHEEIVDGTVDFSPTVTALMENEPDTIIVVGMYNILGPFTLQYKDVDPDINLIGFSNAYSEQLIELAKEDAEGICLPTIFFHSSVDEKVSTFVSSYEEAYGSIPNSLTAQAYDSMGLILTAMEKAGSADREAIKNELYNITYDGVSGSTKFNENGDALKTFNWLTIKDGEFVEVGR